MMCDTVLLYTVCRQDIEIEIDRIEIAKAEKKAKYEMISPLRAACKIKSPWQWIAFAPCA
jgi:hypothetical protein